LVALLAVDPLIPKAVADLKVPVATPALQAAHRVLAAHKNQVENKGAVVLINLAGNKVRVGPQAPEVPRRVALAGA
jgi:hypothetical protein